MKTISSKPSLTGQEFELGELLATNKSLAQEKREVHRQKLRQYSQKAVKLKDILRSSIDHSQRKCLEGKLRSLQQKQDAQINKLAKIDQIEKEIDQYMNEDDHESIKDHLQNSIKQDKYSEYDNEHTPAKRLKTRNVPITREVINSDQLNNLQCSIKSNLLSSSGFNMTRQFSDKKQRALHVLNQNDLKIKEDQKQKIKNSKESRAYSCWQPTVTSSKVPFAITKTSKATGNILNAFTCEEKQSYQQSKFSKDYYLRQQQQKLTNLMISRKNQEQIMFQLELKIEQLVDKQRNLMQRIDGFEKEQGMLLKKTSSFINSIHRSKDIILSSGLILEQLAELQVKQKGSHQFSIDSLESQAPSEGYLGLSLELASFEKLLQQFLLNAQREAMLTSGELQQCGLKINRIRDDCTTLESRKKVLQSEITRFQQNIPLKKKELKGLQQSCNRFKHQIQQFDEITNIKKKLIAQLEQKCEKLKGKKKVLSDKVQKGEKELEIIEQQYSKRMKVIKQVEIDLQQYINQQKQIEESLIFTERKLQLAKKEQNQCQKQRNSLQTKVNDANTTYQKLLLDIALNQKQLVELKSQIISQSDEQSSFQERIRKIQKQIAESTGILDEQRHIITNQNEQINLKSNELLDWQKKIISIADSMRAIEAENSKLNECILNEKQQIEQLNHEKQQILRAKDELEEILREVILKKETLLSEVELRSGQLETLLTDLMEGHEQLSSTNQKYSQILNDLQLVHQEYESTGSKLEQVKEELDEMIEEEANIIARVNKLKQAEKQMLLEIGLKGSTNKLDEELKKKITQACEQLQLINNLKAQLKECKYDNRKLKLDNQRLSKLIQLQSSQRQ